MPDHQLSETLFRKEAIDHINAAKFEQALPIIISAQHWLYLLSIVMFLISAIYWIAYYPIILEIPSKGMALDYKQYMQDQHNIDKILQEKNSIAENLLDLFRKKSNLFARGYLTKPELISAEQAYLSAKQDLKISQENLAGFLPDNLLARHSPIIITLIDYENSKKILVGAQSYISSIPEQLTTKNLSAHVVYRSNQPISKELANFYFHNYRTTDYYYPTQPASLLIIQLETKANLASGTNVLIKTVYHHCTIWKLLTKGGECG